MKLAALLLAMSPLASALEVHGHRGARAARPENTLAAFEYAIAAGVDVLELDMAVTKDDVVVVSHDPAVNATICQGPGAGRLIRTLTLDQVRACDCGSRPNPLFPRQQLAPGSKIPTLEEVFALAPRGRFHFNIETKIDANHPEQAPAPERFVELVLTLVRRHHLETRVILQSFDYRTLRAMKARAPEVRLSALMESTDRRDFVSAARDAAATIVSPHFTLVTPERVRAAHDAGLRVVPWTANTPAQWRSLIAAQVDAIISDDPAALIAFLRENQLR